MPRTVGLVVGFAFGFIGTLASSAADPQAAAQGAGLRCFVSNVRGASTVEGASASMIVTSDGTSCPLDNWGNPDLRQEPATSVAITVLPKHGRAEPAAPRVIYTPQSGYVGEDEFAYEAKAQYPNGDPMTMRVRVKVDVRREPFTSMDVPVRVGSFLRFDPGTTRQPIAGPDGMTMIGIGARRGSYEPRGPF